MAGSPNYKVYAPRPHGRGRDRLLYVAACKDVEAAAALCGLYGDGTEIRWGHNTKVWVEGQESQPASESYDFVAETASFRRRAHWDKRIAAYNQRVLDQRERLAESQAWA